MAGKKREDVREEDVTGLKYFDKLAPLLVRLHDVGCGRDKAGNRLLHFDQYCMLVLLFLFNPVVRSLRAIQQASQLRNVQRKLGCLRASLGSLSEATEVFQPERLKEIIAELGEQLQPIARDSRLQDVRHTLTLVDGTLLQGLPVLVQAALGDPRAAKHQAKVRLHTQFDLERAVPIRIDVTEGIGRGEADERAVLGKALEAGRCYVEDRGYAKFKLFNDIVAAGSSYVCRLRDNSRYEIEEQRPLVAEDVEAGIILDAVVCLGEYQGVKDRPDHPLRLVVVKTTPHEKRGGPASSGLLLIATNLLDLPAWIIALIYRYRWTIEVFFRFFKHVLGCRHLLSHDPVGIEIQTYCAIIACMLISLWTGRKPTLRTYEMICHYFTGLAEEDELLAHLAKLQRQNASA
ncbi:MAG TPA: IS4 family transposase [Thermoguttaceae bacterium]|nr:IS4 family transposase [Thermoguttaceae bacterium]